MREAACNSNVGILNGERSHFLLGEMRSQKLLKPPKRNSVNVCIIIVSLGCAFLLRHRHLQAAVRGPLLLLLMCVVSSSRAMHQSPISVEFNHS